MSSPSAVVPTTQGPDGRHYLYSPEAQAYYLFGHPHWYWATATHFWRINATTNVKEWWDGTGWGSAERSYVPPPDEDDGAPPPQGPLGGALTAVSTAFDEAPEDGACPPVVLLGPGPRRPMSARFPAVRLLEVGAGTGEFCAFLLRHSSERIPNLLQMLGPSDVLTNRDNTLAEARRVGITPICGVNALELANLFDAESLDIVLSSQCYGYGLSRMEGRKVRIDTRFLHAAMHVLRPGGCLVMISRSNLLFYRFMQCAKDRLPCEYTNADLKRINRQGCGAKDRSLPTANQFTVVYPTQLVEMCLTAGCWAEVSPIAPPPGLTSSAHNDRFEEEQRDLHGFNVQIVFTKCRPGVASEVRYLPAPSPIWDRLTDLLRPAAAASPPLPRRGQEESESKRRRKGGQDAPGEDDDE